MADDAAAVGGVKRKAEDAAEDAPPAEDAPAAKELKSGDAAAPPADAPPAEGSLEAAFVAAKAQLQAKHAAAEAEAQRAAAPPPAPAVRWADDVLAALKLVKPAVREKLEAYIVAGEIGQLDVDARAVAALADFPEQSALMILNNFAGPGLATIRNKAAYLASIMKRCRAQQAAVTPPAAPQPAAPLGAPNPAAVDAALEALYARGVVTREQIDARALDYAHSLPETIAVTAITELGAANLSAVRNVAAYLKNICRRHATQAGLEGGAAAPPQLVPLGAAHAAPYAPPYGAPLPPPLPHGAYGYGYAAPPPPPPPHVAGYPPPAAAPLVGDPYGAYAGYYAAQHGAYYPPAPPPYAPPPPPGYAAAAPLPYASPYALPPPGYPPAAALPPPAAAPVLLAPAVTARLNALFAATGAVFDGGAWDALRQLPEEAALAALEQVHAALVGPEKSVRNPSAYFTGIARKYLGLGGAGAGDGAPADAALAALPPRLRSCLEEHMRSGALPRERLDFRVVAALGQLQEEAAIAAVEEMGRTDLSRLRNPSAYLMGIVNKRLQT